ncbi:AAA family ATPase [Streptomyces phaeochromogenes]|uniref:AAA family ATPase n=1 Tax=Streptomyces phaeochromogenes TaxID=1923 RepID=UPI003679762E
MTRRFFAVGTGAYTCFAPIEGVTEELARMSSLFEEELSCTAAPDLHAHTADTVRQELGGGPTQGLGPQDTVVVYYSGHGRRSGGRHYLICEDSVEDAPAATALATEDLVRLLAERGARRLLLIIHTCQAAAGGAEAVRDVAQRVLGEFGQRPESYQDQQLVSFAVVSASRAHEVARGTAFSEALEAAVKDEATGGMRARKLFLESLLDQVNARLAGSGQHATHAVFLSEDDGHPFFPNPRYRADAPLEGVSLADQRAWEQARGTPEDGGESGASRTGTGFVGRADLLGSLEVWVSASAPSPRWLAVTGPPGSGKSALLRQLCRSLEKRAASGTAEDTTVVLVDVRQRTLEYLGARMTEPGTWDGRPVLLVDGLEEAEGPGHEDEPRRIARYLDQLTAKYPRLRVIATASGRLLRDTGPRENVDLSESSQKHMEACAVQLLTEPYGPGSSGWSAEEAQRSAAELARAACGNHVLLRLLALRRLIVPWGPDDTAVDGTSVEISMERAFWKLLWARCSSEKDPSESFRRASVLLTALAFSHGAGLPWTGGLWPRASARAVDSAERLSDDEVRHVLDIVAPLIAEGVDPAGRSAYRLHHEAYARVLRQEAPPGTAERLHAALREEFEKEKAARPWRPGSPPDVMRVDDDQTVVEIFQRHVTQTVMESVERELLRLRSLLKRVSWVWRHAPELFVVSSSVPGAAIEEVTDSQGCEVLTVRVPPNGTLSVGKLSYHPRPAHATDDAP